MILHGDCLEEMRAMEDSSVDSVVTDPPYGISFMGKKWDYDVPKVEVWEEALRVLKPGGHLLSFAGARTYHRMAVNIEDAGFEIRDQIMWVYGSGFPKSLNIGKAVDKLQGNERDYVGEIVRGDVQKAKLSGNTFAKADANKNNKDIFGYGTEVLTKGNTEHEGWGTALKPAHEPIVMARKPLSEKTIAKNVLKWGTGGINVDGCRVGTNPQYKYNADKNGTTFHGKQGERIKQTAEKKGSEVIISTKGRFPANFIHDGSDEVVGLFPETKSGGGDRTGKQKGELFNGIGDTGKERPFKASSGSASRFFYCAKASKSERNAGLEGFEEKCVERIRQNKTNPENSLKTGSGKVRNVKPANHHPTVKPIKLMQYLTRLITPKGGTVLDPYMGSGTTGIACKKEGFEFIGIELDEVYFKIANARIEKLEHQHELF